MFEQRGWNHGNRRLVQLGIGRSQRGEDSRAEVLLFNRLASVLLALWGDPGWLGGRFRNDVVPLLAMPAGPELLAALVQVDSGRCPAPHEDEGIPVSGSPPFGSPGNPCLCLLALAAAWQACVGFAAARAHKAVVDVAGAEPVILPREGIRPQSADAAREELAAALRISPGVATTRIRGARALAALPELGRMIEQGVLPESQTVAIAERLGRLSPQDAAECARKLDARVRRRPGQGRRPWTGTDAAACARSLAVQCNSYTRARKKAVADRCVRQWSNGDGTATLQAVLAEEDAVRIYRRLTAIARGLDNDPRPVDARRADVLRDLVLGRDVPAATGVEVNLVIGLEALLGMQHKPGDIPGLGPVPADVARELAADARWSAWVRDAAGAVTAVGSRTYRPSAGLARLIRAREPYCRMPGCRRPAAGCDLDHAVPWPAAATTPENLGPLCRRHHVLKTHVGWRLDARDPMDQRWTTPAGVLVHDVPEVLTV